MISPEYLKGLLEEELQSRSLFLVDIKVSPANKIGIFIDNLKGVTVEECIAISRFLESKLDRDKEDFELEVSSPGLDSPLKLPVQFQKNIGRVLDVVKFDGLKISGKLTGFSADDLQLETELSEKAEKGKKKNMIIQIINIQFDQIKTAKVAIRF